MRRALSGLTVVELGEGIAPAYCGKLLADLGADVTKVEDPAGSRLRRIDGRAGTTRRGLFLHLNTNKRSMALRPGDGPLLGLVQQADLVIESKDDGALADWGIEWAGLHQSNPDLSVVNISGFGVTGPYKDYKWADIVAQAMAGAFLLQGHPDLPPVKLPGHVSLCFVGHMAGLGALAAVMGAAKGRGGSFVDCSAVEVLATLPSRQAPLLAYQYRECVPDPVKPYGSATLIPTGVFPCADGYVALMSTTQQLDEMLDVLGDAAAKEAFQHPDAYNRPETKEVLDVALYTWLMAHTRAEATALAQSAGWPCAGVYSAGEVLQADHLHQRNFWIHTDDPEHGPLDLPGPWCRFEEGGWALRRLPPDLGERNARVSGPVRVSGGAAPAREPAADGAATRPPLEGVRVVDLTVVWSGPYATMLLADLGAEVIRVENPFVLPPTTKGYHPRPVLTNPGFLGNLYGPPGPGAPDRPWNRHAMNNSIARNKVSVTIDIRRAEGKELLMRLADQSDVFIDNFKANGLDRIGIDISELRRRNPRLIIVRLPPAGLTGDYASYTGFGAQFDALSGLLSVCGHLGSDPTTTPVTTYMDGASGPAGAFAILAALRYRAATGRGQFVELSQHENVINHLGDMFIDQQLGTEPERLGNRDRGRAPQGLYPCREPDHWIAVSVGDDETWAALARVIGHPELAGDERFASPQARYANHDECDRFISEWLSQQAMMTAFHTLQAAGVPAGPLMDDVLFTSDPHLGARQWFRPLSSGDVGTHPHPGFAFSGVPQAWRRGSPTLGEDNEYVYKKILGVSDEDYRRYEQEKMLATDYLKPDGTPY